MISKDTIAKVTEAANIVEVISDFVSLKKKGTTFEAPCPFHNEKSPSFKVSQVKGIYKCFGCGKGGDSISFVMDHEKYTYKETIRYLGKKYNIDVEEEEQTDEEKSKTLIRETTFKINEFATEHFMGQIKDSELAIQYLGLRKLSEDTIKKLQIGYAPQPFRFLFEKLQKLGYNKDTIMAAGISYESKGKVMDRFRERITFPIHNLSGRVAGFTARILTDNKELAKYVNSPESETYRKGEILYGLFFAKKSIADLDEALLVEGNMDVAALIDNTIENSVATSGTALTRIQIRMIKRFSSNLTFIYDGDAAGQKAIARGIELATEEGMNIRTVILPANEDPDSFVNSKGRQQFLEYIKVNRGDLIDFYYSGWHNLTPAAQDETLTSVLTALSKIDPTEIHQLQSFTNKASRLMGLSLQQINRKIESMRHNQPVEVSTQELTVQKPAANNHEIEFIKALIIYGHRDFDEKRKCYFYMMENAGTIEEFTEEIARLIFQEYYNQLLQGIVPTSDHFITHQNEIISNFAQEMIFKENIISSSWTSVNSTTEQSYVETVINIVAYYRVFKIKAQILQNQLLMKDEHEDLIEPLLLKDQQLKSLLARECKIIGITMI